ncbi:MAG: hypothetical protein GY820_00290 [Gammaproteobacteria bacterium]|nr:hypothetical protein [Gammaproteobacteria bacterium]
MGNGFIKYMEQFLPYLIAGLKNHEEYQVREANKKLHAYFSFFASKMSFFALKVCSADVGLVGDLCRALEANVAPYLDQLMALLIEIVQVHYSVFRIARTEFERVYIAHFSSDFDEVLAR